MNKYVQMVDEKLGDLKMEIAKTKTTEDVTKNTRGTKLYKLGRDRRILSLIKTLLESSPDIKLEGAERDTLVLITTLSTEHVRTTVEVNEGDSILELLQKYEDKKNIQQKLQEACEKKSLVMNYQTGTIVRNDEAKSEAKSK